MMKMIVAIMKDEDTEGVTEAMGEVGLCVTRIASTGGFLRQGQSTLMIGVEENLVDQTIQMINDNIGFTVEPVLKRATLFVLNVEHFEQI